MIVAGLRHVAGIWIYVDDQLCFQLPGSYDNDLNKYSLIFTVTCRLPLRGRVVRLSKDGQTVESESSISFCEVQVWGQ